MKALSGLDGAFLHLETPETPMHVGALHVFDVPSGYAGDFHAEVRSLFEHSLDLAPLYRRRLAEMPLRFANPVWADDGGEIDLDYHVRRVRLPRPGTRLQLERCVARLHSELMDRSRPLWQVHVIEGLGAGSAAFYMKVHHAVLDGAAGMALADALFNGVPQHRRNPGATRAVAARAGHPGLIGLAGAALKHDAAQYVKLMRHLPEAFRVLAGMLKTSSGSGAAGPSPLRQNFSFGPKTAFNVTISAARGFAGVSIPLAEVKQIAASQDAKINDVVLALCSGALRRYLAHRGGIPKKPLIATMPISLREAGNTEFTTQATLSLVNLATHIADPLRRLRAIRDASGAMKSVALRAKSIIPTDFPSIGMPWLIGGLASLYGKSRLAGAIPPIANLVISNVPGPPDTLYVAGLPLRAYWPLSIVEHGLGVNITVLSYAGSLDFGIVVARNAVPDVRKLAQALLDARAELTARALPAMTAEGTRKRAVKGRSASSKP